MSKIQLLDCTLRDGGYINNFRFGKYAIRKILQQLTHAGLDIVECGFLEDGEYDEDTSIFNAAEQIASLSFTKGALTDTLRMSISALSEGKIMED